MEELLAKSGLSKTAFRLEILSIFKEVNTPISTKTIEDRLKKFDRVTLYRTLKQFTERGIIHEIQFPNKDKQYALCSDCSHEEGAHAHHHEHIHFLCDDCGKTMCHELPSIPEFKSIPHKIESMEIQLTGICADCLK